MSHKSWLENVKLLRHQHSTQAPTFNPTATDNKGWLLDCASLGSQE